MLENTFQGRLIKELKKTFPECVILKNDANYMQGAPDLMILVNDKWAALECKKGKDERHQPNQDYYVEKLNRMGFSSFIYPENREEVLSDLKEYLG